MPSGASLVIAGFGVVGGVESSLAGQPEARRPRASSAGITRFLMVGTVLRSPLLPSSKGELVFLTPAVASRVATSLSRLQRLSPRETSVLQGVVDALGNKETGERLSISERTVKFHAAAVMSKLGAENRAHAAALGVQRGLVRP